MSSQESYIGSSDSPVGRLCLDFINTVEWHSSENHREDLNSFDDLMMWSERIGILMKSEVKKLRRMAAKDPSEAETVLKKSIELREVVYRILSSVTAGDNPKKEDLSKFNKNLSNTMIQSRIVKTKTGFSWNLIGDKNSLDWMINPVVRSAADLLVSDELDRVKKCADPQCGELFLDVTRNKSRRWCDMNDCGNRAKARRFYKRKKRKEANPKLNSECK